VPAAIRSVLTRRVPLGRAKAQAPLDPLRTGMPSLDSIHSLKSRSVAGAKFRIIRTVEVDAYERSVPAVTLASALRTKTPNVARIATLLKKKPAGDAFAGTSRKAAKLSIASATVKSFNDLRALIESLVADEKMVNHKPKIKTTAASNRVTAENKNVRVKAFLYAASRENDNDFHLIIGRDPAKTPELYMTMELSGLPPEKSPAFAPLKATRDAYKAFFGADVPGFTYDFYDPPIPVVVEGSLFFDMSHATGTRPGPQSLKSRMPTIWEVHPISSIQFEP
jgi:hypothetical protein